MTAQTQRTDDTFHKDLGSCGLCADTARLKQGNVWCFLNAYVGSSLTYQNTVNLGTEKERATVLKALQDKNVTISKIDIDEFAAAIRLYLRSIPLANKNGKIISFPAIHPTPLAPKTLDDVHSTFQKWLRLPDTSALDVALAVVVANYFPGDPVWLLIVDAPGSGKTEVINSTADLPHVHSLSSITEAGLLSGTGENDRAVNASGGILKQIGSFGILAIKDFGSILSLQQDTRSVILQALREIYDGRYSRDVGTDGGLTLDWAGKMGIIGGATPAIDRYHAVLSALGERFVFFRPVTSEREKRARAHRAIHAIREKEDEAAMRSELRAVVGGFFAGLDLTSLTTELNDVLEDYLVHLASLTVNARSPVDRDRYSHEITDAPTAEHPARVAKVLARLYISLTFIGIKPERAWQLTRHTAISSVPKLRYLVLTTLARSNGPLNTSELTSLAASSKNAITRAGEDLIIHHLVHKESGGSGKADIWSLSDEGRMLWEKITSSAIRGGLYTSKNPPDERDREIEDERVSAPLRIAEEVVSPKPTNLGMCHTSVSGDYCLLTNADGTFAVAGEVLVLEVVEKDEQEFVRFEQAGKDNYWPRGQCETLPPQPDNPCPVCLNAVWYWQDSWQCRVCALNE